MANLKTKFGLIKLVMSIGPLKCLTEDNVYKMQYDFKFDAEMYGPKISI